MAKMGTVRDATNETRGASSPVTRPIFRYLGGKWKTASWIASHFPQHVIYIEPFGGGGSVLLRKKRVEAEVYNDLDSEIVNVFRILRDPASASRLRSLLRLTPYARTELDAAWEELPLDPVERARRLLVRNFMCIGSRGAAGKRNMASPAP